MATATKSTTSQTIAWQGWTITVPSSWNPVSVDGDSDEGSLLLADLHAPRLGMRWRRVAPRGDPAAWAGRSLTDEVGKLAAAEAVDFAMPDGIDRTGDWVVSRLYTDPAPPGRDVWVGHSRHSGRVLQVVHHAADRDASFAESVLPSLADSPADASRSWSVFDLNFVTPPGVTVQWYRFNAGDLAVGLRPPHRSKGKGKRADGLTVVRQVGPASLALSRQSLEGWLTQIPAAARRLYRPIVDAASVVLTVDDRPVDGLRGTLVRKRRLWWAWFVAPRQTVMALHDAARDRLVLGQSADEAGLVDVLATVGRNAPAAEGA